LSWWIWITRVSFVSGKTIQDRAAGGLQRRQFTEMDRGGRRTATTHHAAQCGGARIEGAKFIELVSS
jgi:hypothetical protein